MKHQNMYHKFIDEGYDQLTMINSSKNIFLSADETQNFYKIKKEDYQKIIHENVTKAYKKVDISLAKRINREAK